MRHSETIPVTCVWCDVEVGRYAGDGGRAVVYALAKAHDLVCPNHPGWIEVKALQEKLRQAEADLADARFRAEAFESACTKALNERDDARFKAEELLDKYSRYLEKRGFMDCDWYTEGNTVTEFLDQRKSKVGE